MDNEQLKNDAQKVWEWLRHPDWAETFNQKDILDWIESRPSAEVARLLTAHGGRP